MNAQVNSDEATPPPVAAPRPGAAAPAPPGPPTVRRWVVLAVCCLSLFLVMMDATKVNVALPQLREVFGADVSQLQWVVDAYSLVLAALLVLAGATADRIGRRRTFQIGLVAFAVGSLLCGVAPTMGWLIAFRVVQAVGGSMLNPVAMSIITHTFADPKERAQAVGLWGAAVGLGIGMGPVLGGLVVQAVDWRAIFWLNVPICVAAVLLTRRYVPESRSPRPRRLDLPGQGLLAGVMLCATFAVIEGPESGWTSPVVLVPVAVAVLCLVGLVVVEPRTAEPVLDPRFFRSVPFSTAVLLAVAAFAAFSGFLFLNTQYLQDVRGLDPMTAGLALLPLALSVAVAAPLSGRLVGRRGPRLPLLVSGVGLTVAGLLFTRLENTTPWWYLMVCYLVFGLGFGFVNAPITTAAVSGMPRAQAGVAGAMASVSRQLGTALGVAVMGSSVVVGVQGSIADGLVAAARPSWWIVVGCGLAVVVLGLVATTARARAGAAAMSRSFDDGTAATAAG